MWPLFERALAIREALDLEQPATATSPSGLSSSGAAAWEEAELSVEDFSLVDHSGASCKMR
jgi:hypothetical protein